MTIAFFDLDKTLISDNSARLWLQAQWKERAISFRHMLYGMYWLTHYHLGFRKMDDLVEKGLTLIRGHKESVIVAETRDFFHSTIKKLYRPGALEAIKQHRAFGHQLSLLTSSFDGLAMLVKEDLGFDHCLCTRLEVDVHGFYTGKSIGLNCFGANKIIFAESLCRTQAISMAQCIFYTDSASDIPLMKLVGTPVAVNPDPHLRARARRNKWLILDWGSNNGQRSPRDY
jgi:HAD superfamily hydrolase (TIGR01490 family)